MRVQFNGYKLKIEIIMSEEARYWRRSIIELNRQKRKKHDKENENKHGTTLCTSDIDESNDTDNCGDDFTELSLIPSGDINEMLYEKAFILGMNVMSIARPITDRNIFNELEGNRFRKLLNATNKPETQLSRNINTLPVKTYKDFMKISDIQREIDIKYLARRYTRFAVSHIMYFLIIYLNDDKTALVLSTAYVREVEPDVESHMTAIVLFNPYRPGLKYRDTVKLQQHIYMHLLKRYLMMKYGTESEANEKFMHLYYLDMRCKQYALQRQQVPLPPLLREVINT
ncbi:unnamed protein product [Medioppia subpectinata]|uniref:Uncharacterized protein n=1 Tax=Medioppia subpectinata TaxID=1979941 RepID=A0A7R9KG45_9ACAR|nr:unnamed protein product [Medioppia subpectinata]CAG2101554.1 unnamed protein product [Medioppia subpectinata]